MTTIYDVFAIIGGAGVILIALFKFLGDILLERFKSKQSKGVEKQIAVLKNELELMRKRDECYFFDQYDVYKKIWESLQGLRLFIDALWYEVNDDNLLALTKQLAEVRKDIRAWSIFMSASDFAEIERIITIIGNFGEAKARLLRYREADGDGRGRSAHFNEAIKSQIEQNKALKEKFEAVLVSVQTSFRRQMSGQTEP